LVGFPQLAKSPLTLRRNFAGRDGNILQLDLPAGEGFSGAPLLQRSGKVLGVVTDEDPQLTFAVRALLARDAVIGWGGKLGTQSNNWATSNSVKLPPFWPDPAMCIPGQERVEKGIVYVRICPGTFTMGSAENDKLANPDEKPAHQVTLSEFWIGKTEITNEQYRRFRSDHRGEAKLPATWINWFDAKAACEHFGGRLPTEAQWEYAARAGSQSSWSFGDDKKMLDEYAWYGESSDSTPHPVGTKKPNTWGLFDMYGNVSEWVADWYIPAYSSGPQTDPIGPTAGEHRVVRGNSVSYTSLDPRSAIRDSVFPKNDLRLLGFRCVRVSHPQP